MRSCAGRPAHPESDVHSTTSPFHSIVIAAEPPSGLPGTKAIAMASHFKNVPIAAPTRGVTVLEETAMVVRPRAGPANWVGRAEPSTLFVNLPSRRKSLISKLGQMKLGNPGKPFI